MKKRTITAIALTLCMLAGAQKAAAIPELIDWGISIDGESFCGFGPCDFDTLGGVSGTDFFVGFPSSVDVSLFDIDTSGLTTTPGTGTIVVTLSGDAGMPNRSVDLFLDHLFGADDADESASATGVAGAGESAEADNPTTGDIFDNFVNSALDNQTTLLVDDVAMAIGRDLTLLAGETAVLTFIVSENAPASGFFLTHSDPSGEAIFLSSSLDITGAVQTPEPATMLLLAAAMLGAGGCARRRRHRFQV